MELAAEVAALDDRTLAPVVERLLGRRVAPIEWSSAPLNEVTLGLSSAVFRVRGTARDGDANRDWSVVLKVLRPTTPADFARFPAETHERLTEVYRWDREFLAYESGLLDSLPAGLRAARCLGLERRGDRCWLWLEDLGDGGPAWDTSRYALAARHLGRFNGAFDGPKRPNAPWLCRDWIRTWLTIGFGSRAQAVLDNDAVWEHELVRAAFSAGARARLRRGWASREALLDRVDAVPTIFSHLDAFRTNLFDRVDASGGRETVAIDWSYVGIAPIGAEVGQFVIGSVAFADFRQDIRTLAPAAVDGYIAGLRDSGWSGDERDVRTGFALSAVRWVFMLGFLNAVLDPARQAPQERWSGQPYADTVAQAGARTTYLLDLIDGVLS